MPWKVVQRGDKHCVVKKDDGKTVACHDSEAKAKAQLRALYMKEKEHTVTQDQMALQLAAMKSATPAPVQSTEPVTTAANGQPIHIHIHNGTAASTASTTSTFATDPGATVDFAPIRLYFREGEKTPDGRVIDPNAVNFDRSPPYSITLQTVRAEGHQGAVVCGVITKIARDGLTIVCDGFLDLTLAAGQEAFNLINNRTMQTWSPDLGDAVVDYEQNVSDEDVNEASHQDELAHFVKATFLGATLVPMPALASAVVELLDASGTVTVPAPDRALLETQTAPETGLLRYITDRSDNEVAEIAACAAAARPPSSFFTDPELPELQRWTSLTSDGRVFGHAAGRDECHIGFRNQCITIDHIADVSDPDCNFEVACPGYVICDDDTRIPTGPITIKGGHAPRGLGWRDTLSHYDDPSAAIADVVYGVDAFGIWFSGAIRPTATDEQIRTLLASGVSLDAREVDGKLRYLATCAVNTPGYPKLAARFSDDKLIALIAAGGHPEANECDCNA